MSKRKRRAGDKRSLPARVAPTAGLAAAQSVARDADSRASVRTDALTQGLCALMLIGIGLAAYCNSFHGVFILDDKLRILDNPQIRHLWPPWVPMVPSERPVLDLTLALNYAIGGLDPWTYHAFNLAVHLGAGLLLFGIVRRMLQSDALRARYGGVARWLALGAAGLWLAHPLQTESVTYVIQRAESLMGLFFLATVYCGIRSLASAHARRWQAAAIVACALGMGTKEVMVVAPMVMLVYDRTFAAPSFAAALRQRRAFYAGLAATWLVLAAVLLNRPTDEREVYLVAGLNPWNYALTQFDVILHYLRLALWPDPLVLDYRWPVVNAVSSAAPAAAVVLALVGGTCVALRRRAWIGFWGAWFFLILAPTSSILPIADVAFEHRMYLPLAAVAVVLVVGGYDLGSRLGRRLGLPPALPIGLGAALVAIVAAALTYATILRNEDYRSELAMWSDTVADRPGNPRAHLNLGLALKAQGRLAEAIAQYDAALRLKPDYAEAHNNLGNAQAIEGRMAEAVAHWNEALRLKPDYADAHLNLGMALYSQGQLADAIAQYREALRFDPDHAGAHNSLGIALVHQGKLAEAAAEFAAALRLDPGFDWARENLRKVEAARSRAEAPR